MAFHRSVNSVDFNSNPDQCRVLQQLTDAVRRLTDTASHLQQGLHQYLGLLVPFTRSIPHYADAPSHDSDLSEPHHADHHRREICHRLEHDRTSLYGILHITRFVKIADCQPPFLGG